MFIANAPCSWGVLEFEPDSSTPSVAAAAPAGYPQVLDEIRDTGYVGTELGDWGFMPTDPARLRDEIAARTLRLIGAFVPVPLVKPDAHAPGAETAIRTARLLRETAGPDPFIVLADDNATVPAREQHAGRITPELGLNDAQWATFAQGANRIARDVREATGLRTVFHPHCGGYVETPAEIDTLMARTDPNLLGLCFDTGHTLYGGGDPVSVFERHAARVWHVHFKDCDLAVARRAREQGLGYLAAVRARLFSELGTGGVDFPAMVSALKRHAYRDWIVVEQDVFPGYGSPADSARRNRQFLASLGL
jgi:inosose dehydratase